MRATRDKFGVLSQQQSQQTSLLVFKASSGYKWVCKYDFRYVCVRRKRLERGRKCRIIGLQIEQTEEQEERKKIKKEKRANFGPE